MTKTPDRISLEGKLHAMFRILQERGVSRHSVMSATRTLLHARRQELAGGEAEKVACHVPEPQRTAS